MWWSDHSHFVTNLAGSLASKEETVLMARRVNDQWEYAVVLLDHPKQTALLLKIVQGCVSMGYAETSVMTGSWSRIPHSSS